jgi:general stress protein CsbA
MLIGILFKIQHWSGSETFLDIGYILGLGYMAIGSYNVFISKEKTGLEKLGWLIGFLILSIIAGFIYYHFEVKSKHHDTEAH